MYDISSALNDEILPLTQYIAISNTIVITVFQIALAIFHIN